MAFSQQSYAGQGIVQPMAIPSGAPALAAGIQQFGAGVSKIIDAYANKKAEDKRKAGVVDGLTKAFTQMGVLDSDAAKTMSYDELVSYGQLLPQLLQQQTTQQQAGFLSEYLDMQQPQSVAEPAVTNQMIDAARQKVSKANMDYSRSLPPVIDLPAQESGPSQSFLQQLAPQSNEPEPSMLSQAARALVEPFGAMRMAGEQLGGTPDTSRSGVEKAASALLTPMGAARQLMSVSDKKPEPTAEEKQATQESRSRKLFQELEEAQRELDTLEIRMAEDDFNLRPETVAEVNQRFAGSLSELIKKYPKAAGLAYQLAVKPGEAAEPLELNESERKAYQFGTGMMEESKIIDRIESSASPESFYGWLQGKAPNFAKTEDFQNYEAAKRRWAEFNLRALTGAEARESEVERNVVNFFPQPGDSPATIRAKREARQNRMRSIMFAVPGAPQTTSLDLDYDPSSKSFR
jgi:hypothetical protein